MAVRHVYAEKAFFAKISLFVKNTFRSIKCSKLHAVFKNGNVYNDKVVVYRAEHRGLSPF